MGGGLGNLGYLFFLLVGGVGVVGSNTYANYRHHADGCHAYQILKQRGYDEDKIVMIAYDDVADDKENPFPGKLFNKPTEEGDAGFDVYDGCNIDYKGNDATKETFYSVLTGDAAAGGKVLTSTKDDDVFVYFVDHGGVGLIAMPVGDYVYYDELNATLTTMHEKNMYNKLVFYLEACESGSMFEGTLSDDISIYATTAANAEESSWGCYCGDEAMVDGVNVGSCLGDLYSVSWLENSDSIKSLATETLEDQYEIVKEETDQSHVMEYGDASYASTDKISEYQTNWGTKAQVADLKAADHTPIKRKGVVDSRDATLYNLMANHVLAKDGKNAAATQQKVVDEVHARDAADKQYRDIVAHLGKDELLDAHLGRTKDADCLRDAVHGVEAACGRHTDYSLKYIRVLNNACVAGFTGDQITKAAGATCLKQTRITA